MFINNGDNIVLNTDSPKVQMALRLSQDSGVLSKLSDAGVLRIKKYVKMTEEIAKEIEEDEREMDKSDSTSESSGSSFDVEEEENYLEPNNIANLQASQDSYDKIVHQKRCFECGSRPCVFNQYETELCDAYDELLNELADTEMGEEKKNSMFRYN